jgi:hypothetical protein
MLYEHLDMLLNITWWNKVFDSPSTSPTSATLSVLPISAQELAAISSFLLYTHTKMVSNDHSALPYDTDGVSEFEDYDLNRRSRDVSFSRFTTHAI